jgi:hypothetical protein
LQRFQKIAQVVRRVFTAPICAKNARHQFAPKTHGTNLRQKRTLLTRGSLSDLTGLTICLDNQSETKKSLIRARFRSVDYDQGDQGPMSAKKWAFLTQNKANFAKI